MAAPCPLLGDGITDDMLHNIARFLPTAKDLVALQLTNMRFAAKVIAAAPSVGAAGGAEAAPEMLCIAEEAGRLWVAGCSEQERGWVPRLQLESWLGLMREVALLRAPLLFGRAHGDDVTLSEGGALATNITILATMDVFNGTYRTAASTVVMRSGRHFARFTVVEGDALMFGVIRPGWDVEGGVYAQDVDGHCFYCTYGGRRQPGGIDWEGMQHARKQGDRIGMLLDQGSMTVWKNDVKLGVMQSEGLSGMGIGPLCWAVSMGWQRTHRVGAAAGAVKRQPQHISVCVSHTQKNTHKIWRVH